MGRKRKRLERKIFPDVLYNNVEVSKFINVITLSGKKSTARNIVYKAFKYIKNKFKKNPLSVFCMAMDNVSPMIELKNYKVGASSYTVPSEINNSRRITLSMRWIKTSCKIRKEKYMYLRLANELLDASLKKGLSIKKKFDLHKAAQSNKLYSNYQN